MASPVSQNSFVGLLEVEAPKMNLTSRRVTFPAGHVVFREGDFGDGIYIIDEGIVEISSAMPERQCRVLSLLGKGDFFGEMAVVDEQPRSATATTQVETHARFIPREDVWSLLARAPSLLVALMREVSARMRRSEQRCTEDVFQAERLAVVGRFAQSIVHDLKNPLNTIRMGVDVACAEDSSPAIRREAGTIVTKQVERLAGMIHEVLEFTRGTTRSLVLEPMDFCEFIRSTIAEMQPVATERGVAIECESEPPSTNVFADRLRLTHVLYNLVNNAVDAMPSGGKITLRFRLADHEVLAELEDTGPGIAPAIAMRLFEPFVTHGKTHGTGLGLSICKRIIEDHGGRIGVMNGPGRGAIFTFSLRRQV